MKISALLAEPEIKVAIANYIYTKYGVAITAEQVQVQVKSKQNYKSEWEEAAIKCEFEASAISKVDQ